MPKKIFCRNSSIFSPEKFSKQINVYIVFFSLFATTSTWQALHYGVVKTSVGNIITWHRHMLHYHRAERTRMKKQPEKFLWIISTFFRVQTSDYSRDTFASNCKSSKNKDKIKILQRVLRYSVSREINFLLFYYESDLYVYI